jgi:hypothetical protein
MSKVEIAYKNYLNKPRPLYIDSNGGEVLYIPLRKDLPTLESFIDKVLTDDEFNQEWGDNCTRELTTEERNVFIKSNSDNIPKRIIID